MTTLTIAFAKDKDTKNTVKFAEVHEPTDPEQVGTLYVQKFALARLGNPERLHVTITKEG